MILDSDLPEIDQFRAIEAKLPFRFVPQFGNLVVAADNDAAAVHNWFRYKESYSAKILSTILPLLPRKTREPYSLLDPFCGVGTTLLWAQSAPEFVSNAIGIEKNPFVAFVARTKLRCGEICLFEFDKIISEVTSMSSLEKGHLPSLSSISRGTCISPYVAGRLIAIRDRILQNRSSAARDALLLGLASAIEPLSKVRKDGRALRLVDRGYQRILPVLSDRWKCIRQDVIDSKSEPTANRIKAVVYEGDGRNLEAIGIERECLDLVFTSPPYPNNIDYSEVYKLELWMLGFVSSADEFLKLRKATLRSHPTSDLSSELNPDFKSALEMAPLADVFGQLIDRVGGFHEKWRLRLLLRYFSDIWFSLQQQFRCLRAGGFAFYVVANSLHGRSGNAYLVPTDVFIAAMGSALGYQVDRVMVMRNTKRRLSGNHFLRESIVVLRKPE